MKKVRKMLLKCYLYNKYMKHKTILLVLIAMLASLGAGARTQVVTVSKLKGELTANLRGIFKGLNNSDMVIINFDKPGKYVLKGTVECNSNIEIKGVGSKKVTIDADGFKAFTDDTFIKAAGTRERPITVSIHDVAINLKLHKGIWWENAAMFGVKIYHANKVDICRVNSYADNAIFTNFDLRVCSNITFKNCTFTGRVKIETGGKAGFENCTFKTATILNNGQASYTGTTKEPVNKGKAQSSFEDLGIVASKTTLNDAVHGHAFQDKVKLTLSGTNAKTRPIRGSPPL